MRLIDNLRNAERKSMARVRRQMERAKDEWSDVERRLRQRMRIYPQKLRNKMKVADENEPEPATMDSGIAAATSAPASQPIISVNGRDIPEQEIDKKNIA
jgi:hypothetical protein